MSLNLCLYESKILPSSFFFQPWSPDTLRIGMQVLTLTKESYDNSSCICVDIGPHSAMHPVHSWPHKSGSLYCFFPSGLPGCFHFPLLFLVRAGRSSRQLRSFPHGPCPSLQSPPGELASVTQVVLVIPNPPTWHGILDLSKPSGRAVQLNSTIL